MNSKIIAVDFDGTLCENKWPEIGEANEDMIYYLRKRQAEGDIQLSEKERKRIIRKSLQKYSWKTKCTVAMEEFAELQQQISKQVRGYGDRIGLLEEMADAYICLNFLESIFDIKPEDLQKAIDVKLERERRNL